MLTLRSLADAVAVTSSGAKGGAGRQLPPGIRSVTIGVPVLLLIALVLLVVGLVGSTSVLLAMSLAASVLAAALLLLERFRPARRARPVPAAVPPASVGRYVPTDTDLAVETRQVWVVDGLPDYHVPACPQLEGRSGEAVPWSQAVEDGFLPCAHCRPSQAPPGAVRS